MHVLMLPSFYPSDVRPHTGIFFKEQADALRKSGHKVGVLVAPRIIETIAYIRQTSKLPDLKTATVEGCPEGPVYRMHWGWFPRIFPLVCAWLHNGAGFRAFDRYCDEYGKPDIIHAHNIFYSGYMAARIKQKYGIPVVLTEHSTNFLRGRIFLPGQHMVARYTLRHTDRAFAVGKALADRLEVYADGRKVGVTGNVVNTDFFVPVQTPSYPFTFAGVGGLQERKGFDLLIESFARVYKDSEARLLIGGEGEERRNLEALIARLGLQQQVKLLGRLSREQVRDLFQESHCIVSASNVETFGVTLIEAMSCGKPVIATRSGGPEGFVTEETGVLIPVQDVDALSAAMQKMQRQYSRYDSSAIREYAVKRFSETAIAEQLTEIYQQIVVP